MRHIPSKEEPSTEGGTFRWRSSFGIAVGLFLGYGILNVVVGLLSAVFSRFAPDGVAMGILMINERADTELFGDRPKELVRREPAVGLLRKMDFAWMGGSFMSFGLLQLALTWFGLRRRQPWAFWTLVAGDFSILPYWAQVFAPYRERSIRVLPLLPPLFTYPLLLLPPAAVLAWRELRQANRTTSSNYK